jgi:ubiquinone biosynthesis protein
MRLPRSLQILLAALRFSTVWWWQRKRSPDRVAACLRATVESLGTTFIKLAQGLSLRMDLLPKVYRTALAELQSRVAPFPSDRAILAVEAAFGAPVDQLFAHFDPQPLAAASVAQIHRAKLPDGRSVIVKVRRPGIVRQVGRDLRLLRWTVRCTSWLLPALRRQRPLALIDELGDQLFAELDLRREAQNVRRLAAALREQGGLHVPAVIDPLITADVMVQEFAPGRPVSERFGAPEGAVLAVSLLDAYLHQLFVVGAFHADPHPGNLFARDDGRLCLHDFGLVGSLDTLSRQALGRMLEAVIYRDAETALAAAIDLGFVAGAFARRALQRGIDTILAELQGQPLAEWSLAETLWRIAQLGAGEHFRIPRHLLVLLRALFLLESTLRALHPQFDLVSALMARRELLQTALAGAAAGPAGPRPAGQLAMRSVRDLPRLVGHWLQQAQADDGRPPIAIHHRGLERLESRLERVGNRLVLALLALGLYVGGAVLMLHSAGPWLYGVPIAAVIAFMAAVGLTLKLIAAVLRSDGL